jgi:hypothetical protein
MSRTYRAATGQVAGGPFGYSKKDGWAWGSKGTGLGHPSALIIEKTWGTTVRYLWDLWGLRTWGVEDMGD